MKFLYLVLITVFLLGNNNLSGQKTSSKENQVKTPIFVLLIFFFKLMLYPTTVLFRWNLRTRTT